MKKSIVSLLMGLCMGGLVACGGVEPAEASEQALGSEVSALSEDACGDGVCTGSETHTSCPEECPAICGNGVCENTETPDTCYSDCCTSSSGDTCM